MSEELKAAVEAGMNQLKAKLENSIERYESQLKEAGTVASETRAEVKALSEQFEKQQAKLLEIQQKGLKGPAADIETRSIGDQFVTSDQFKMFLSSNSQSSKIRLEVKNTVDTNATNTFPFQKPGIVPGNFQPLTVRDTLVSAPVNQNAVEYIKEASWTNSAAEASHGSAKKESDITFSVESVPIRTIAHWIKITKQLLDDAPAVARYIDVRLRDGLAQRIDAQLINGDGTSPNLSGLTDTGNFTAYTPTSDDNLVDAMNRLLYVMWPTGNRPDVFYVNPADWGAMERTRESDNSGMYLYGIPGLNAGLNPWGVRVVITKDIEAGKIIAANTRDSIMLYNRQGVAVEMGYVNDDFTRNLVTIRAEERLGLAVERPAGVYYGDFTA